MKRTGTSWRGAAIILLAGVAAACGGDGTGSSPPSAITATTPTALTATVATAISPLPSVRVLNDRGRPVANVPVTFAVTSGGGSIAGGSAATNSDGVASVGGWTLGTAAGVNTLTATVAALPPVQFSATGTAGAPAALAKVSGEPQTGTVATALAQPLVVRVTDAHGNPAAGVAVSFAATAGGGSVLAPSTTTDAQGLASTTLVLGRQPGANAVTATAPGLAPVSFTATAQVGPPAAITRVAGDNQQARAGTPVPVAPSVAVTDAAGNPVAGVTVTFAVASGGGSVTGAVATTGADGRAAAGSWTLGAAGTNTLTATAGSAGSVTFTATATAPVDPCTVATAFTLRTALGGTLAAGDCSLSSGELVDLFVTSSSTSLAEEFILSSSSIDSYLVMADAAGRTVAFDDDGAGGNSASIRVLAPPGQYILAATSFSAGQTGAYQLSSRAMLGRTTCVDAWIVPGLQISRSLASGDCTLNDGTYADVYPVYLRAGQQLTVVQRSTGFDTYLVLTDASFNTVAEDDDSGGGSDSRIVFTAPRAGAYMILANSFSPGATGTYSLSVTSP